MSRESSYRPASSLDQSPGYFRYESTEDVPKGPAPRRPYFALGLGGAIGGFLGVLFGHLAVLGLFQLEPRAGDWLKGPHGPPFFSLALSIGFYYGFLGAGLFRGRNRLKGAGWGSAAGFLSFSIPMAMATRFLSLERLSTAQAFAWVHLVLGLYMWAGACALWVIGALCGAGAVEDESVDWRAGLGALGGAVFSYTSLQIASAVFPSLRPVSDPGLLPHKIALLDGLVSGLATGLAVAFTAVRRVGTAPKVGAL